MWSKTSLCSLISGCFLKGTFQSWDSSESFLGPDVLAAHGLRQALLRSEIAASRGRRLANYEPQGSCQSPKLIVICFLLSLALIWERKMTSIWIKLEYFDENGQLLQRSPRFFWVQEYKTWRHILLRRKVSVNAGCCSDPVGFASMVSRVVSLPGRTYLLGSPFLMKYFVGIKVLLMEIITNIYSKEEL